MNLYYQELELLLLLDGPKNSFSSSCPGSARVNWHTALCEILFPDKHMLPLVNIKCHHHHWHW